jgi:hypothetical protein
VPIYQVEWELSDDKWQVLTDTIEYPVGELEPGNSKFIPLSLVMVAPNEARITLRGLANESSYERNMLISRLG